MTTEEYNKYYKGLTFTSTTSLACTVYTLSEVNNYGNICIYWSDYTSSGFNKTSVSLNNLEHNIKLNRWVISKKDIRKRKIQLLKNDN